MFRVQVCKDSLSLAALDGEQDSPCSTGKGTRTQTQSYHHGSAHILVLDMFNLVSC